MSERVVRYLPCDACAPEAAMLPNGEPYTMGRHPFGKFPLKVRCARCRRTTLVGQARWNALPQRTRGHHNAEIEQAMAAPRPENETAKRERGLLGRRVS